MAISDFYDSTVEVKQLTTSQTSMGGSKKSYSTRIASLSCRLSPRSVREVDEYGRVVIREVLRLYCEATSTNKAIVETDRVVYGTRTFEVTGVGNPGMQDHHLEIDLKEVR